ncbi:conserved hypothetical protein, partial [Trichinella spiralis]|uniref:hypothetical protein n=1 Tax=Trichinella spiralis TaxID=6334 RepID=UPI0001EFE7FB
ICIGSTVEALVTSKKEIKNKESGIAALSQYIYICLADRLFGPFLQLCKKGGNWKIIRAFVWEAKAAARSLASVASAVVRRQFFSCAPACACTAAAAAAAVEISLLETRCTTDS